MHLLNHDSFIFGSINSLDYGVYVLDVAEDDWGERDVDTASIQGRSGDIVIDYDKLNNTQLTITIAITESAERNISILNSALLATVGYLRLEHSFDENTFRNARYIGRISPKVSRHGDLCVTQLKFDCMPQKYWKIGETSYDINIGASASTKLYKTGYMGELMSDAFKSLNGNTTPYEKITILSLDELQTLDVYYVKLVYPEDMQGKRYVYGYSDKDPTSSAYNGGMNGRGIVDGVKTFGGDTYVYFTTPASWEVTLGQNVVDKTYSAETIIENASPFQASPLIKIKPVLNTAFSNVPVLMVNDKDIRLINEYGTVYSEDDVLYIDCETMNAYRIIGDGVKEYMNKYVVLPNSSIVLKSGTNTIYTNSNIRSAEIVPRWWSR